MISTGLSIQSDMTDPAYTTSVENDRIVLHTLETGKSLTRRDHRLYIASVNTPGSFGERARSRLERGGSCFLRGRRS